MTSPNTIIANLVADVDRLTRQRDQLLTALIAFRDGGPDGGQNFKGWQDAYLPAVELARAAIFAVLCVVVVSIKGNAAQSNRIAK